MIFFVILILWILYSPDFIKISSPLFAFSIFSVKSCELVTEIVLFDVKFLFSISWALIFPIESNKIRINKSIGINLIFIISPPF